MILSCQNISKAFVENQVLKNVSFHIEDHEKAAIVGINGAGKTTLLRIIVGEMTPDDGQVVLARDKTLGYLAQNSTVDTSHTIYEELLSVKADLLRLEEKIRECENNMKHAEGDALEDLMKQYTSLTHAFETGGGYLYRSELVGVLKGLGFTEDEFSKPVATLSGGQKTRVALGRLLLQNPDLIILDEPTNHLDIMSKEILEDALNGYEGTILYVSHDRYFINRTAHRILDLTEGQFISYVGNYDYYLEKHDTVMAAIEANAPQNADADSGVAAKAAESEVKLDWKAQKEEQARLRKKENDLKKCEEKIAELEARISEIDTEMSDPTIGTQVAKLQELSKEQTSCQEQLEKLYEQWEELAE